MVNKYERGDAIYVQLEEWAIKVCKNPPEDGIAKGVFLSYLDDATISDAFFFKIDGEYECAHKQLCHSVYDIIRSNSYCIKLL